MSIEDDIKALGKKLMDMSNEPGRGPDEWVHINDMHACTIELAVSAKKLRKAENGKAMMKG
jgi:hypothetical protein